MDHYSNAELADMHLMYGLANCNRAEARRLYAELFPDRRLPGEKLFQNLHARLMDTGSFKSSALDRGRPTRTRTPALEERVLEEIEGNRSLSTRRVALTEGVDHMTIWRVLKYYQLHPYHLQRVQGLGEVDFAPRIAFCNWLLHKCAINPNFPSLILFTDEASFTRNGIINFHNLHIWQDENPHAVIRSRYQQQFSINVWGGIIGDFIIGPFFLPGRLTGAFYRQFLETHLPELLECIPLAIRASMWLMHDGAPPHFSGIAREFLDNSYPDRWIGRGGPVLWPARSPDLNPLDFYLWGHLKGIVYSRPVDNIDDLRLRIEEGFDEIRRQPGICERVRISLRRRAEQCILAGGGHFEHIL
jgi:hypothetical protein